MAPLRGTAARLRVTALLPRVTADRLLETVVLHRAMPDRPRAMVLPRHRQAMADLLQLTAALRPVMADPRQATAGHLRAMACLRQVTAALRPVMAGRRLIGGLPLATATRLQVTAAPRAMGARAMILRLAMAGLVGQATITRRRSKAPRFPSFSRSSP